MHPDQVMANMAINNSSGRHILFNISIISYYDVILQFLKCCLFVNNNVWCERYLVLFVAPTVICKRYTYKEALFTRPSLFDRSEHVLMFTFWVIWSNWHHSGQSDIWWICYSNGKFRHTSSIYTSLQCLYMLINGVGMLSLSQGWEWQRKISAILVCLGLNKHEKYSSKTLLKISYK